MWVRIQGLLAVDRERSWLWRELAGDPHISEAETLRLIFDALSARNHGGAKGKAYMLPEPGEERRAAEKLAAHRAGWANLQKLQGQGG